MSCKPRAWVSYVWNLGRVRLGPESGKAGTWFGNVGLDQVNLEQKSGKHGARSGKAGT